MAYVTPDKFSPYPRVCDICGKLRSIATMRKLDGITWVCDSHPGERTAIMLDLLNAHARPPQTWPNKDPKPQNPEYPNTLESDEGFLFSFIDRQIQAQCRFELVASGAGPYLAVGGAVPTMAWAVRYLYGLIVQGTRTAMLPRARVLLGQAADYLLTRQYGSLTGPSPLSTRATDAFFGGFLASGAVTWVTEDTSISGLALLYAYRIIGTKKYLVGARSAASFLRNVQAIGKNGTNYTSSDSAGVTRFYTGSLASEVADTPGFYSNSLFYPSALLALEFWNELTITDGDQSIGATATPTGFSTVPVVLMSVAMADLRLCWTNGILDSAATLINGLSSTTPREFFNAFPATKANFLSVVGTGRWEYADGGAATGTQITAQNFSRALSALYNFEGATSQVTTILTWLRSFTSNPDFETPDNTSDSVLARTTTGDYDPTVCLSTLLTVRDVDDSFAAIAINGSSLYDWGSFGLIANLLAATNMTSFKNSRLGPLNIRQRFYDGINTDGYYFDRIELRGLSGLTYQTAFASDVNSSGPISYPVGTTGITSPSTEGNVLFLHGSVGLSATTWLDQAGQHQDADLVSGGFGPTTGVANINGIPAVTFPLTDGFIYAGHAGALKDRNGVAMPYTHAITVYTLFRPKLGASTVVGGPVFASATQPNFECLFDIEAWFVHFDAMFVFDNIWKLSGFQLLGPDTSTVTWDGVTVVGVWRSSGYPNLRFAYNSGADLALTDQAGVPTTNQLGGLGAAPSPSYAIGNCWNAGGAIQQHNFHGDIAAVLVYDYDVTGAAHTQNINYLASQSGAFSGADIRTTNDAIRASQFGTSYRLAH